MNSEQIDYLLSPQAIRERTRKLFDLAIEGKGAFKVHLDRIDPTANLVYEVIQRKYPDFEIPFHSRWSHFNVGGVNRIAELEKRFEKKNSKSAAKAKLDLVIVSVLLDAGAG